MFFASIKLTANPIPKMIKQRRIGIYGLSQRKRFGSINAAIEKNIITHIKLRSIIPFIKKTLRMHNSDQSKYRPWIETRLEKNTYPKYKILSRQLHLDTTPTLTIHTAGQRVVWEISIQEAALDPNLLAGMDLSDQELVKWIYENDYDVDRYFYNKK